MTFALIAAGAIGGVGSGFAFVPWLPLIQHHTADAARGRVVAATEACEQIAVLAGMGVASPVLSMTGPQRAYGLAGLLLAAAVPCALAAVTEPGPVAEVTARLRCTYARAAPCSGSTEPRFPASPSLPSLPSSPVSR